MKYPNLRYGNPTELAYYAQSMPLPVLAKLLRRDLRTVRDYLAGKKKIPWWIPELLRLRDMERQERMRQMRFHTQRLKFGIVAGQVVQFKGVSPTNAALDLKHDEPPLRIQSPLEHAEPARQHARTG